jgi:glycosyltransferase involved in cell wall biosynthesis
MTMGRIDRMIFRAMVPRAARRADHVIAVSERTREDVIRHYGISPEKVTAIQHGVDPAFTPGEPNARAGYVLFVGAIHERKNPLAAADAAESVGLPLVVVGPSMAEGLTRALLARGAELRGYVDAQALVELYRGAAALVLPSRHEGFGLPVLEAMACGTPVVISSDQALREVVGDAAASNIQDAIDNRARLSAAGIERARLFSWEKAARRTAEVYRKVLAR